MIQKAKLTFISIAALTTVAGAPVFAQSPSQSAGPQKCGSTTTQIIKCQDQTGIGAIGDLIKFAISVMTILIGVVATGGLAYAGIIYATAQDDQSKVSEAKNLVRNVIIGLLMYGFTIAIIGWLIPGSVINTAGDTSATTSPSPSSTP